MPRTSEEEVLKLSKKITKYHEKGNTSSMCDALSALRRLPMTVDILKNTQVGKKLNQLRTNVNDKEVKQQIRNLIKYWKEIANTNTNNRAASGDTDKQQTEGAEKSKTEETNSNGQQSITGANVQKQMSDIPLQLTGDTNRDKMREMLAKHLKNNFDQVFHQRCNECK